MENIRIDFWIIRCLFFQHQVIFLHEIHPKQSGQELSINYILHFAYHYSSGLLVQNFILKNGTGKNVWLNLILYNVEILQSGVNTHHNESQYMG